MIITASIVYVNTLECLNTDYTLMCVTKEAIYHRTFQLQVPEDLVKTITRKLVVKQLLFYRKFMKTKWTFLFLILATNFRIIFYMLSSVDSNDYFKRNLLAPFYGYGSTASRLEPLRGSSLLFTTKFLEIPGTHFIDLGKMIRWVDIGATQWFWTRDPSIGNPAP